MSGRLILNQIEGKSGASNIVTVPTGHKVVGIDTGSVRAPGSIIQVVQTTKTDVFSTTSTSYVDVTGLSVTITPISSSNKILVIGHMSLGVSTVERYSTFGRLMRDGSAVYIADTAGNRDRGTFSYQQGGFEGPLSLHFSYLDSPAKTTSTVYNVQIRAESPQTAYINRGLEADGDSSITPRTVSSITVMEVVG